jgi:3-oxoacyl-[acyl-carrier protein] reductase
MDVRGKTIVVTGAGRGIGRAIAQRLARQGAHLALFDRDDRQLDGTRALCEGGSVCVETYRVNVADEYTVCAAMAQVKTDFGRLDGIVNNAGIVRDALLVKVENGAVVKKLSLEQWAGVIDVNLTGVFLCTREAVTHMIECGHGGVVVNISSISRAGNSGQTNYSAAKAGIVAMSVVWARELARHGIRVGAVAPGFTETEMLAAMRPDMLEKLTSPVPLRRLGTPDEIAQAVSFVFENEFFTGRCLDIDGGLRL